MGQNYIFDLASFHFFDITFEIFLIKKPTESKISQKSKISKRSQL